MQNEEIRKFLVQLGLESYEIDIYLILVQKGIQSPLEISRHTGINRTKVYRRIESLKKSNLIQEMIGDRGVMYKASDFSNFEFLVREKQDEINKISSRIKEIKMLFSATIGMNEPETKVLFYRGIEGIKQMIWNTLRSDGEVIGYSYRPISEVVGLEYAIKWEKEFIVRGLHLRDIYSDEYMKATSQLEIISSHDESHKDHFSSKYVSSKSLDINYQTDIYNDVVSYYAWHDQDIFGVEIYNARVAKLQHQIFNLLWSSIKEKSKKV